MLGFSALTEDHPDEEFFDFNEDDAIVASGTTESARQLNRFQHVLNSVQWDPLAPVTPSHLMAFSDCAFLVYDNPLVAAMSAVTLMRAFLTMEVPVRMGMALGTWHVQRFSFDIVRSLTITRAVFYGTGVVRATLAEMRGGKGCRIFLDNRLDRAAIDLIRTNVEVLDTPEATSISTASPKSKAVANQELNYLFPNPGLDELANDKDQPLLQGVLKMRQKLQTPVDPDIDVQYTSTLAAIKRMRTQLGRST
jgi:hypothetical protein